MDERILEFIGDLRRAEIRISPSEAPDALAASAEVGLGDRETFKSTLAATLIKEFRDQPTFDRLFNLYFLDLEALGRGGPKGARPPRAAPAPLPPLPPPPPGGPGGGPSGPPPPRPPPPRGPPPRGPRGGRPPLGTPRP